MSVAAVCLIVIAAWSAGFYALANYMAKKEVADYYELQVSKASHPAGKALRK